MTPNEQQPDFKLTPDGSILQYIEPFIDQDGRAFNRVTDVAAICHFCKTEEPMANTKAPAGWARSKDYGNLEMIKRFFICKKCCRSIIQWATKI